MRFRKREDFYKNRNKIISFLFKWALRLSFPLRKPLAFVLILLALFLIPTFCGIKPLTVPAWYWEKIKSGYSYVADSVVRFWKKSDINVAFIKSPFAEKGVDKLVDSLDNRAQKSKRQAFGQASQVPVAVNVQQQDDASDIVVPVFHDETENFEEATIKIVQKRKVAPAISIENNPPELTKKPDNSYNRAVRGLIYLEKPQSLSGKITVYDVNTLDVNGTYLILFGIYADPKSPDGAAGRAYLLKNYDGKNAVCQIIAYTEQHVATAICYVDNVNLNKQLVIKGYSLNVAL